MSDKPDRSTPESRLLIGQPDAMFSIQRARNGKKGTRRKFHAARALAAEQLDLGMLVKLVPDRLDGARAAAAPSGNSRSKLHKSPVGLPINGPWSNLGAGPFHLSSLEAKSK